MILPNQERAPVGDIISQPYIEDIADWQDKEASIKRMSQLIHEVNPDYLLLHPTINSYQLVFLLASYASLWLCGQMLFFLLVVIFDFLFVKDFEYMILVIILMLTCFSLFLGFAPYLTFKQLKQKKSQYNKLIFLKKTQQVGYYEHKRKHQPTFHLFDYKDLKASIRRNQGIVFEALNLHVIDDDTGDIIHSIVTEDLSINAYDQWTFIRTYMERPADELPLNEKYAQACPTDMSQSLYACADIAQISKDGYYSDAKHHLLLEGWMRACAISYLDLAEGNIYQSSANPALHPDVQKQLTWDGQHNPYNILPVTPERQAAFNNQNPDVLKKWRSAIVINIAWFVGTILFVMLVVA